MLSAIYELMSLSQDSGDFWQKNTRTIISPELKELPVCYFYSRKFSTNNVLLPWSTCWILVAFLINCILIWVTLIVWKVIILCDIAKYVLIIITVKWNVVNVYCLCLCHMVIWFCMFFTASFPKCKSNNIIFFGIPWSYLHRIYFQGSANMNSIWIVSIIFAYKYRLLIPVTVSFVIVTIISILSTDKASSSCSFY